MMIVNLEVERERGDCYIGSSGAFLRAMCIRAPFSRIAPLRCTGKLP